MTDRLYFRYWGKAKPDSDMEPGYHLLPYHRLDVAAVGSLLTSPDQPLCKQLAEQLQVEPDWLRDLFVLFVLSLALHDLGKFSRSFQGLQPDLSPDLVKENPRMPYAERHDSLGFWVWIKGLNNELSDSFPSSELTTKEIKTWLRYFEPWLEIVTGHHGIPPKKQAKRIRDFFETEDEQAALSFVQDAFNLLLNDFDFRPLLNKELKKRLQGVSWQLAGIAVLADWLGSNQDYFHYCSKPQDLKVYWHGTALQSAKMAIRALPKGVEFTPFTSIKSLFDFIEKPTPLQKYAVSELLADKPQLFILEDVTGAGKTEAALVLVHRLMSQGLAGGLYVALPTMATANAMYQRLGQVYRKFYRKGDLPSLILAHGWRFFHSQTKQSLITTPKMAGNQKQEPDHEPD